MNVLYHHMNVHISLAQFKRRLKTHLFWLWDFVALTSCKLAL